MPGTDWGVFFIGCNEQEKNQPQSFVGDYPVVVTAGTHMFFFELQYHWTSIFDLSESSIWTSCWKTDSKNGRRTRSNLYDSARSFSGIRVQKTAARKIPKDLSWDSSCYPDREMSGLIFILWRLEGFNSKSGFLVMRSYHVLLVRSREEIVDLCHSLSAMDVLLCQLTKKIFLLAIQSFGKELWL